MTLYRKYRPQLFADVVGRKPIITILTEEIRSGHIAHAYLFSGVRGTGKTSIARLFAKAINCQKRDAKTAEPCNACESCTAITKGASPDVIEIDAASNRRIDEIRELREHIKYAPANAPYKVYIVDEVHMLTAEAFNALLKTLEEPPAHAVFVLATTELQKIPDTIFSRCQHFSFGKLALVDIVARLKTITQSENVSVPDDLLLEIARRADGALRDAESLLGQIISIGKKDITHEDAVLFLPRGNTAQVCEWLLALSGMQMKESLEMLAALESQGVHMDFFLAEALSVARHMLLYAATRDADPLSLAFSPEDSAKIISLAKDADIQHIRRMVSELLRSQQAMKLSTEIPILPLELCVVSLCADVASVSASAPATQPAPAADSIQKKTPKIEFQPLVEKTKPVRTAPTPAKKATAQKSDESAPSAHSLEEILDGWGEVLGKVKSKSATLNFILGVGEPIAVKGNKLEVGFKYRLQQEKVLELGNREVVERVLEEVYGAPYRVEATLKEDIALRTEPKPLSQRVDSVHSNIEAPKANAEEDALVKAALTMFEGAVVEN